MPPVTSAILFVDAIQRSLPEYSWFGSFNTAGNLTFNSKGHAHATANAQTGETLLRVATNHFVQQRDKDSAAQRRRWDDQWQSRPH